MIKIYNNKGILILKSNNIFNNNKQTIIQIPIKI
jgi:hypothetical protein